MSNPLGFPLAGFGFARRKSFIEFLNTHVAANLQLVIDPGDINSMASASAQTISDIKSTGDAWMGTNGTVEGVDPTFSGTPGDLANEAWDFVPAASEQINFKGLVGVTNNFARNTQKASICFMFKPDALISAILFSNQITLLTNGITIQMQAGGAVSVTGVNDNVIHGGYTSTALAVTTGYNFFGWSNFESGGAGNSFINLNGAVETFNLDFGPNATAGAFTIRVGSARNGAGGTFFDGKIGPIAAWDTNLTQAQMAKVRNYLLGRYG